MSSPIVFSLTAAQRDCLAMLAAPFGRAFWPNFRRPVRDALHRMGLVTAPIRPELTDAGRHAAGLASILVNGASLRHERAGEAREKHAPLHGENSSVGLAHVAVGLAHKNSGDSSPACGDECVPGVGR